MIPKNLILSILTIVFLVGCGGGNNSASRIQNHTTSMVYNGLKTRAVLTQENKVEFIKMMDVLGDIYNIFQFFEFDEYEDEGRVITSDINPSTGVGNIQIAYDNYQIYTNSYLSGTVRINILENNPTSPKIRVNTQVQNLRIKGENFDITIDMEKTTEEKYDREYDYPLYSNDIFNHFVIKDNTTNTLTRFDNLTCHYQHGYTEEYNGQLFLEKEGYVEIHGDRSNFQLTGENGTKLELKFSDHMYHTIKSTLNDTSSVLYYKNHGRLITDKPPIIQNLTIMPYPIYTTTDITIKYDLMDSNISKISFFWYVNDHLIKEQQQGVLPHSYFKKDDNITVVVSVENNEAEVSAKTTTTVSKSYINLEINKTNAMYDKWDSFKIKTNAKEIVLEEIIDIQNPDDDSLYYFWSNSSFFDTQTIHFLDGSKYTKSPKIKFSQYGNYDLSLVVLDEKEKLFLDKSYQNIINQPSSSLNNYDNIIDFYFKNAHYNSKIAISLKIEAGLFEYQNYFNIDGTSNWSQDITLIDINHDGLKDIVFTSSQDPFGSTPNQLVIMLQKEDGTFANPQYKTITNTGYNSNLQIKTGDMNGDTFEDIIVNVGNDIALFYVDEKGTIASPEFKHIADDNFVQNIEAGDFNNDGLTDIVATHNGDLYILYQNQNKTLDEPTKYTEDIGHIRNLAVGDFNGDKKTDFMLMGIENNKVLLQSEQNQFISHTFSVFENRYPTDLTVIDFNNDGYEDIVFIVNSLDSLFFEFAIIYGSANGLVESSLEYKNPAYNISVIGRTLSSGDINGDGKSELIVDNVVFVINEDKFELYSQQNRVVNTTKVGVKVGDINQDNKEDIIMLYQNSVGVSVGISTFSY